MRKNFDNNSHPVVRVLTPDTVDCRLNSFELALAAPPSVTIGWQCVHLVKQVLFKLNQRVHYRGIGKNQFVAFMIFNLKWMRFVRMVSGVQIHFLAALP
jgi:hypothetical protein